MRASGGRSVIFGGLAAALLLLVGLLFYLRGPSTLEPTSEGDAVRAAGPAAVELADSGRDESARQAAPAAPPAASPDPVVATEPLATPKPPAAEPPKDAEGVLSVTVLDSANDQPVALAKVVLTGLRRKDDPGSWHSWPGETPSAETDERGRAELPFPAWVEDAGLTCAVDMTVSHPDYAEFRDHSSTIESLAQNVVVRLGRGAFLIVSGWVGAPEQIVRDVKPRVDDDADLSPDSWAPVRDGRPSTSRLSPGPHAIAITWRSPEGVDHASRVETFELAPSEQREMSLELVPASALEGKLDPAVPRPVEDGEVEVSVDFGSPRGPTSLRTIRAKVEADGSFRIENLPPGRGQVIAMCKGWVSKRIRAEHPTDAGITGTDAEAMEKMLKDMGNRALVPARISVPAPESLLVRMEPTAKLAVRLETPSGEPVSGAIVQMWPNVRWWNGYSQIFLERTWIAESESDGRAEIENIPPGPDVWVSIRAHGYRRVGGKEPNPDTITASFASGETTEVVVVLERTDG